MVLVCDVCLEQHDDGSGSGGLLCGRCSIELIAINAREEQWIVERKEDERLAEIEEMDRQHHEAVCAIEIGVPPCGQCHELPVTISCDHCNIELCDRCVIFPKRSHVDFVCAACVHVVRYIS